MGRRRYERVVVGWRVIAKRVMVPGGDAVLTPISRLFSSKSIAEDYRELALREGEIEPYVQAVERPERKVPDIA